MATVILFDLLTSTLLVMLIVPSRYVQFGNLDCGKTAVYQVTERPV